MEAVTKMINGVDVDRLQGTIQVIKENPAIAAFKFRASNRWVDGAVNVSSIKSFYGACQEDISREDIFEMTADEPDILLGTNKGPNPAETLLHALASCLTTSLVYHAAAGGIKIEGVSSTYEGDLDLHGFLGIKPDAPKGFTKIRINVKITGDLTRNEKEEALRTGQRFSPVYSLVSQVVPLEVILN